MLKKRFHYHQNQVNCLYFYKRAILKVFIQACLHRNLTDKKSGPWKDNCFPVRVKCIAPFQRCFVLALCVVTLATVQVAMEAKNKAESGICQTSLRAETRVQVPSTATRSHLLWLFSTPDWKKMLIGCKYAFKPSFGSTIFQLLKSSKDQQKWMIFMLKWIKPYVDVHAVTPGDCMYMHIHTV